ncbi:MAG: tetratricopeptide repeat protein [Bacteroidota bacterium]
MRIYLLIITSLLVSKMTAQDPDRQFYTANQSYEIGEYAVAIEQYESLLASDYQSAALYYNLGNAYYRSGDLGEAVLNYERAARLDASDEDIQHNLALASSEVGLQLDQLPPFFLTTWKQNLEDALSTNAWSIIFLCLLWLTLAALVLWQVGKQRTQRKWGFLAAFALLLFTVTSFSIAAGSHRTAQHSGAAIILEEVPLRKGANAASPEMIQLLAGIKVKLLKTQIQDWQKVRLSNGQEGWLPVEVIEEI